MKHTMVRYSRLSTDVEVNTVPPATVARCPKLSRYKVLGLVSISTLAFILMLGSVLSSGPLSLSLNTQPPMCSLGHPRGNQSLYDFDDFVDYLADSDSPGDPNNLYRSRYPGAIIIGARKAGTRALIKFLGLHPDVVTAKKETHFFDRYYDYGIDWYLSKMPLSFDNQLTVEKTPNYFVDWDVPGRIHKFNSSIRLLLIVRNPINRAVSDYLQLKEKALRSGRATGTFEEMVIDQWTGQINKSYAPIKRSLYSRHLEKWLALFPLQQILVVDGENIKVKPWEEMHRVETFLGLSHKIHQDCFVYNESKGFYCLRVKKWNVTDFGGNPWTLSCLADSKGREHPDLDPDVREKLANFFKPFNRRFFNRIGRNFTWL